MNNKQKAQLSYSKPFDIILAAITWFALILQMCHSTNLGNTLSYFTIQSNLLIAISLTIVVFFSSSKIGQFFLKPTVQSALLTYIIIVSLVFNIAIRPTLGPGTTAGFIYDNILHVVTPLFYLVSWALYVPKGILKWHDSLKWLLFPLAYFLYSIIRGSITHWYPYFFADLNKISYSQFVVNTLIVLLLFLTVGLVVIFVDSLINKKKNHNF